MILLKYGLLLKNHTSRIFHTFIYFYSTENPYWSLPGQRRGPGASRHGGLLRRRAALSSPDRSGGPQTSGRTGVAGPQCERRHFASERRRLRRGAQLFLAVPVDCRESGQPLAEVHPRVHCRAWADGQPPRILSERCGSGLPGIPTGRFNLSIRISSTSVR